MNNPCLNEGPEIYRLGCTKFNEGCTKGSKVRSEVGIGPKSLFYGFLNEIMAHPCSDGGLEITRVGYTKFHEGCTKGSKVRAEVGINPKSLFMGF